MRDYCKGEELRVREKRRWVKGIEEVIPNRLKIVQYSSVRRYFIILNEQHVHRFQVGCSGKLHIFNGLWQ